MKKFPWVFTAIWLAVLSVMIWAGFWQLGRAEEKRLINQRLTNGVLKQPKTAAEWQAVAAFEKVSVSGEFHPTHLLLDNQIMAGQIGHFVFSAFRTVDGLWLLLNRGWVAKQPDLMAPAGPQTLEALVADWPSPGVQLGEQTVANQAVQHVTYLNQEATLGMLKERLCQHMNQQECIILPRVLKLDPDMAHGFKRQWQLPRMTVEKHQAYATQWFTMSVVLCLVYGIFLRKMYASKN